MKIRVIYSCFSADLSPCSNHAYILIMKTPRAFIGLLIAIIFFLTTSLLSAQGGQDAPATAIPASLYDLQVQDIDGKTVELSAYKGQLLLIVNTASLCGYTSQYAGLESLYQQYKSRGFTILAFPSNNFLGQEPGTNADIKEFCAINYKTTFPLFSRIEVTGRAIHPLYRWLTAGASNPSTAGNISWNFNKFLVSRDGKVLARFDSKVEPLAAELVKILQGAL